MIEVYKIILHMEKNGQRKVFIPLPWAYNKAKCWKIRHKRKHLFTQHIVKLLDSLPEKAMMATNLDNFQRRLDKFIKNKNINSPVCKLPTVRTGY